MSAPKTSNQNDQVILTFKDTHPSIVNGVRRIILDEVPTFAIEDVEVVSNESPLYDETLAHRLGLVPLKTDLKSYNFKETCSCGGVGCALCEVKLTLVSDEEGYVYSGAIKSDDPQITPVDAKIPVTKLFPKKKLEVNMRAQLGVGRDHSKFSPAHTFLRESGKNDVDLIIEAYGQLDAKEIYNKAMDILIGKIEELESKI